MTRKEKRHCETCGAKIVEYKHGLSKGLLRGLYKLAKAGGGPINLNTLGMNYNQQSNFQKLRYWGLVEKSNPDCLKGGDWNITAKGWSFMKGEISVHKQSWSYRGVFVRYDGEKIAFKDVTDGYQYRPEYAQEARAHR
jgi:hypothetical protein